MIPTDGLMANLRTSLGAERSRTATTPPARHVSLSAARTLAEQPQEWARDYSCFRVESWNRDLATSCYFYAGTDQQMIYLELTLCVLPPIMERFQDIDYVVEFGEGPVCATARQFLRLPTSVWTRLQMVLHRMQPRIRRTRGIVPEYYGAHRSLREHVAVDAGRRLFPAARRHEYVKIVDTKLSGQSATTCSSTDTTWWSSSGRSARRCRTTASTSPAEFHRRHRHVRRQQHHGHGRLRHRLRHRLGHTVTVDDEKHRDVTTTASTSPAAKSPAPPHVRRQQQPVTGSMNAGPPPTRGDLTRRCATYTTSSWPGQHSRGAAGDRGLASQDPRRGRQ